MYRCAGELCTFNLFGFVNHCHPPQKHTRSISPCILERSPPAPPHGRGDTLNSVRSKQGTHSLLCKSANRRRTGAYPASPAGTGPVRVTNQPGEQGEIPFHSVPANECEGEQSYTLTISATPAKMIASLTGKLGCGGRREDSVKD